jgi:hypothetical protein
MDVTNEMDMMKDGARRMQEFLQNNGVEVKHSVMLEAISAGFGSRNWRTVRDKLNAPVGGRAVTMEQLHGFRWAVHGIYCDNDQRYTGFYKGETALEAQIIAQVERMFAEDGAEIKVSCVVDRLTGEGADAESFVSESAIVPVSTMLRRLAVAARRTLGERPQRGVEEAEAWDFDNLAINIFEVFLGEEEEEQPFARHPLQSKLGSYQKLLQDELNQLWFEELPEGDDLHCVFEYTDSRGVNWDDISATEELEAMLDIVGRADFNALSDKEKICVYQGRAIIAHARELFDHVFANFMNEP